MKKRTTIRLAVIVPGLVLFSIGAWIGTNMLAARQLPLIHLVEIGDVDGVKYVCRWDPAQASREGYPMFGSRRFILLVTPLYLADDGRIARALIHAGADVNAKPMGIHTGQCSPLHIAASEARPDVVRVLIAGGAEVNARDKLGFTPLDYASMNLDYTPKRGRGHCKAREVLRQHGAHTAMELVQQTLSEESQNEGNGE